MELVYSSCCDSANDNKTWGVVMFVFVYWVKKHLMKGVSKVSVTLRTKELSVSGT